MSPPNAPTDEEQGNRESDEKCVDHRVEGEPEWDDTERQDPEACKLVGTSGSRRDAPAADFLVEDDDGEGSDMVKTGTDGGFLTHGVSIASLA